MLKFKKKLLHQDQGFTLIEVVVAILIATIFVTTTMQAMVIAVVFKVKAKHYNEAKSWIQKDLENVRYKANITQLAYDATRCDAAANTGYADKLRDVVGGSDQTGIDNYVFTPTLTSSTNKILYMTRTMILPTIPPYSLITVNYKVSLDSATSAPIASIHSKVIPDAAFQCP